MILTSDVASRKTSSLLKAKCLVIDDWGIDPISPERRADLLEIIDDQYDQRSVIISSQLPIEHWHAYIGDHTIADAILDGVIRNEDYALCDLQFSDQHHANIY
jgi:DNA replication protein DnaC